MNWIGLVYLTNAIKKFGAWHLSNKLYLVLLKQRKLTFNNEDW